MDIQLIQGEFSSSESLDIVAQMIQVKIRFHENAIASDSNEEDIKYRESRIKQLQSELSELKKQLNKRDQRVEMNATISLV